MLHKIKFLVMKKFFLSLILVISILPDVAGSGNPPAPPRGLNPPPGMPIDQYLIPLFIIGLLIFGIVYRKQRKTI